MAGMLASPRNRCKFNKDNPQFDDGFYQLIHLSKTNRKAGRPTGGRLRRRNLRAAEKNFVKRDFFNY